MADKKKMSVADILAAARKADSDEGGESTSPAESAGAEAPASEAPASKPAASKPAKPLKPGERPNVADILAAARSGGKGGASPAEKAKPKPAAKPAAKKATPAKAASKEKPAAPAEDLHTASILAGDRPAQQHGPISKTEAAARGQAAVKEAPKAKKVAAPPMPEKPAYAKPKKKPAKVDQGRRTTLASVLFGSFMAIGYSALAATFSVWTLGVARFMFPNVLREPPSQFKVGFPSDFPAGQVETKFKAQFGVWIVNGEYNGEPEIYALRSVCTHLGCTPNWLEAEQKFKCPCHGSGFYKDGINFEGPAPRPLERFAIHVADDGQLEVDKSKTFQEEMGQWRDPACYVPV